MNQPNEGMREYAFPPNNNSPETLGVIGTPTISWIGDWMERWNEEMPISLCDSSGVSGYESKVLDFIRSEIDLALAKQRSEMNEKLKRVRNLISTNVPIIATAEQEKKANLMFLDSIITKDTKD